MTGESDSRGRRCSNAHGFSRAGALLLLSLVECGGSSSSEVSSPPDATATGTTGASSSPQPATECASGTATLATATAPAGLALDATAVYFTDSTAGTVSSVPRCGGTATVLAMSEVAPTAIAVDGSNVYWISTDQLGVGSVRKVPLAGGAASTVATEQGAITSLAADGTNVYWLADEVQSAPAAGGPVRSISAATDGRGLSVVGGVAYWLGGGQPGCASCGSVLDVSVSTGAAPSQLASVCNGVYSAIAGDSLFVTDQCGSVWRIAVAGGLSGTLAGGINNAGPVAVDDANVYYVNDFLGVSTILRVASAGASVGDLANDGGASRQVFSQQGLVTGLAASGKSLFYTFTGAAGAVVRLTE